jgi:tetratricopeptide (TPR) repeat protein
VQDIYQIRHRSYTKVLTAGTGSSAQLVLAALILAKHLGIRAFAVELPGHLLLRCYGQENGTSSHNFELLEWGRSISDLAYAVFYKLSPVCLKRGIYLRNLHARETAAILLSLLARAELKPRKSAELMKRALALNTDSSSVLLMSACVNTMSPEPDWQRGVACLEKVAELDLRALFSSSSSWYVYLRAGKSSLYLRHLEECLKMHPCDLSLIRLACMQYYLFASSPQLKAEGKSTAPLLRRTIELGTTYLKANPCDPYVLFRVSDCHFQLEDFDKACSYVQRAVKVKPHYPQAQKLKSELEKLLKQRTGPAQGEQK